MGDMVRYDAQRNVARAQFAAGRGPRGERGRTDQDVEAGTVSADQYKHLNRDGDGATIGIEEIAGQVMRLNYGFHRLLSACVRIRLAERPNDMLAREIKSLLDKGLF